MITENLSTLKIHKLTQEQYDRELENGNIDETALYLTPDSIVKGDINVAIHDTATSAGYLYYRKYGNIYYLYGEIGIDSPTQESALFDIDMYGRESNDFKFPSGEESFMVYKKNTNEFETNYEPISMRIYQDEGIDYLKILSLSSAIDVNSKVIINIFYII